MAIPQTTKGHSGRFKPKFPKKYSGDWKSIIFRSTWELKVMRFLDENPNVLSWSSEEVIVPYVSPVDGRMHRYFPDFVAQLRQADGSIKVVMIEVKPYAQTMPPKAPKRRTKRFLAEVMTWGTNEAKWASARLYCEQRGWEFMLMTEKDLGLVK